MKDRLMRLCALLEDSPTYITNAYGVNMNTGG